MKIIESIVKIVLWIIFILACFLTGWCLRGIKARKEMAE
jgi:hypothetical protein